MKNTKIIRCLYEIFEVTMFNLTTKLLMINKIINYHKNPKQEIMNYTDNTNLLIRNANICQLLQIPYGESK